MEELLNSLRDVQNVDVMKIISSFKLKLITEEYQRKLDQKAEILCNILKTRQKKRNNAFLLAISEFLEECEKKNLKPIFFKGLFLAADLYDQMEKRISNDIDIIIPLSDFHKYNEILENLGYIHEFYCEDLDNYEYYREQIKQYHLGYIKEVNNETVHIEIHASIVNPASLFENITDEFIQNASIKELLGLKIFILDIEYNLVALSMHFFKHLPLTYFQNLLFQRAIDVNLSNIHDIALLVNKYKSDINWEKVLSIAKRMKVVKYFLMVATFVNKIYGEIFEADVLKMFSDNIHSSILFTENSERGGLGKLLWLFDMYVDYCFEITPKQFLLGKLADGFNLTKIGMRKNSTLYSVHKDEKKCIDRIFQFSLENHQNKIVQVYFHIIFSTSDLVIQYHVNNKICCPIVNYKEECYKKDGIEIIVIKDNYIVHRMFTIKKNNTMYSMVVYSNNTESIMKLDDTEVVYYLDVQQNNFNISLRIPWSYLDINCERDKHFLFNIAGLISNPETCTQERACNIFNPDKFIWDFRGINGIKFVGGDGFNQ